MDKSTVQPTTWEKGWGLGSTVATAAHYLYNQTRKGNRQRVRFASSVDTQEYDESAMATEINMIQEWMEIT